MIAYRCDGCGRELARDGLRYTVRIDVRATYEATEIGLTELVQDHRAELIRLIDRLAHKSPKDVEESIYKCLKLDLCPACQRAFIDDPLRFHPEQGGRETRVDIDAFLRSLGYGGGKKGSSD